VTTQQLLERVRREYAALPGLELSEPQVRRLWGLDPTLSHEILRQLVDGEFLRLMPNGHYVRSARGAVRPAPVASSGPAH
jgi:hypothetical protein